MLADEAKPFTSGEEALAGERCAGEIRGFPVEVDEYRKLAEAEDVMWYFHAVHGHVRRALQRTLPSPGAAELLDAGCGTGGLITRLSALRPEWHWTGVDISPLACSWTRTRGDFKVVEASLTGLPLASASFDAVTSVDVLYHIDDDEAALRELWRVLRPGGLVVINVPAYQWLWSYHDEAVHSVRRYGRAEVVAKLRAAGLRRSARRIGT